MTNWIGWSIGGASAFLKHVPSHHRVAARCAAGYHPRVANAVVITVSDSRSAGQREDVSGRRAADLLGSLGLCVADRRIVPDEAEAIRGAVCEAARNVELVVTTGGTGVGPRDVTPEAIEPLLAPVLPGFGEIMRTGSFAQTPLSIISRGGAGLIGRCLVVMLPGNPRGVEQCLELVGPAIKHLLKLLAGRSVDCQQEAV